MLSWCNNQVQLLFFSIIDSIKQRLRNAKHTRASSLLAWNIVSWTGAASDSLYDLGSCLILLEPKMGPISARAKLKY